MGTKGLNTVTIAGKVLGADLIGASENRLNKGSLVRLKQIGSNLTSNSLQYLNLYDADGIKRHTIETYTNSKGFYALIFQVDPYQLPHMLSNAKYEIYASAQWMSSCPQVYARGSFSCAVSLGSLFGSPGFNIKTLTGVALDVHLILREIKIPSRLLSMAKSPITMNHLVYLANPKPLNLFSGR